MVPRNELEGYARSTKTKRIAVGAVVVAALGALLYLTLRPAPVKPVPEFELPMLRGGSLSSAELRGSPVVLNFFASWCEPCKKELPEFTAAARQLAGKVAFIGVNSKEITAPAGVALARSMGLAEAGITLARDVGPGSSALHDRYEVRNAMPITAFYDAAGKLKYVAPGQLTKDKLSSRLQEFYGVSL